MPPTTSRKLARKLCLVQARRTTTALRAEIIEVDRRSPEHYVKAICAVLDTLIVILEDEDVV